MGRGASRTSPELCDLEKAWVTASVDPIVGIDQTAARFADTVHNSFIDRASKDDTLNKGTRKAMGSLSNRVLSLWQQIYKSLRRSFT